MHVLRYHKVSSKVLVSIVIAAFGSLFMFLLASVVGGVVGNAAYAVLPWIWDQITRSLATTPWPWIITFVIFLAAATILAYGWTQYRFLKGALNTTNAIVKLDDALLMQLASIVSTSDLREEMRRLLMQLLQNATVFSSR